MTKWKNEMRKRGVKFENDYPCIPFDAGSQSVLGVYASKDEPKVIIEYSSLVSIVRLQKNGTLKVDIDM